MELNLIKIIFQNIILKSFSNKLVNDNKFYEKLFVTAVMEKLYSSYNILYNIQIF